MIKSEKLAGILLTLCVIFLITENASFATPLTQAAKNGHTEAVQLLLNQPDIVVDQKDASGNTPLRLAAIGGHIDIVKKLIDHGANLNAVNNSGETPLMGAAISSPEAERVHAEIVKELISHGADVNHMNKEGFTALHTAVLKGYAGQGLPEIVQELVNGGANPNLFEKNAGPVLEAAISRVQTKVIQLLVDAGADVNHTETYYNLDPKSGYPKEAQMNAVERAKYVARFRFPNWREASEIVKMIESALPIPNPSQVCNDHSKDCCLPEATASEDLKLKSTSNTITNEISSESPMGSLTKHVMMLHKQYVTEVGNRRLVGKVNEAFTVYQHGKNGLRVITYLPEQHWENNPRASAVAETISRFLTNSNETIFIENAEKGHGLYGEALLAWNRSLGSSPSSYDEDAGLSNRLHLHVDVNKLEPLETGSLPFDMDRYLELSGQFSRAQSECIKNLKTNDIAKAHALQKEVEEINAVYNRDFRNQLQGRSLDERAPVGHSWAIGGSGHAPGVKQYLLDHGWTDAPHL